MKGGNSLLIHRMHLDDHYVVLDVNSGAVHIIDKMIYDILGFYDGNNPEETKAHFKGKYADSDVEEVLAELKELQEAGLLFSPDFSVPDTFAEEPILKSLCLHVAHDCNLRCGYCFADTGDFGGHRALMSKEVAQKAIEFAIKGSKKRHNLELDLFGGEPLMNMLVVKFIVDYVRKREKETGKNIKLTLTTNGTLLTDEIVTYLNDNRVMLVLSLDGSKKTHDHMRPYPGHLGSFDKAVEGFKKSLKAGGDATIISGEPIPITTRILPMMFSLCSRWGPKFPWNRLSGQMNLMSLRKTIGKSLIKNMKNSPESTLIRDAREFPLIFSTSMLPSIMGPVLPSVLQVAELVTSIMPLRQKGISILAISSLDGNNIRWAP